MTIAKKIVLHFPLRLVDRPIVCALARDYNLEFNILKAAITPDQEGMMILELSGSPDAFHKGTAYLERQGVTIEPLEVAVRRSEEKCTHCGACVAICPADAFGIDAADQHVSFDDSKCLACGLCLKACPARAVEVPL